MVQVKVFGQSDKPFVFVSLLLCPVPFTFVFLRTVFILVFGNPLIQQWQQLENVEQSLKQLDLM